MTVTSVLWVWKVTGWPVTERDVSNVLCSRNEPVQINSNKTATLSKIGVKLTQQCIKSILCLPSRNFSKNVKMA